MKTTYLLNNQKQNNMKTKMMKSIGVITTFLMLTIACSKKDNNTDVPVPLSKAALLGDWNISSVYIIRKSINGTTLSENSITDLPNSYIKFSINDSIYKQIYNQGMLNRDTLHYGINDNEIIFTYKSNNKDTNIVKQLTKNKLIILNIIQDEYLGQPAIISSTSTFTR